MKEIIEQILKEEEEAGKVIEKTKLDAQNLIVAAQKDSKELLDGAASEIKGISIQKQMKSEKSFLAEKEEILKKTKNETTALRESREKDIAAVAKEVFLKVIYVKD